MPIYVLECEKCNIQGEIICTYEQAQVQPCPKCEGPTEIIPSLVTMRPDTHWMGKMTQYGYQTSSATVKRIMREKHHVEMVDRDDIEGMAKQSASGAESADARTKKQIRDWTIKTFGPSGMGMGGDIPPA